MNVFICKAVQSLVGSEGLLHTTRNHFFQVGSPSPLAHFFKPSKNFFGAVGRSSICLKMSSKSELGSCMPAFVGMPLMGANRLQEDECPASHSTAISSAKHVQHHPLAVSSSWCGHPAQVVTGKVVNSRHASSARVCKYPSTNARIACD